MALKKCQNAVKIQGYLLADAEESLFPRCVGVSSVPETALSLALHQKLKPNADQEEKVGPVGVSTLRVWVEVVQYLPSSHLRGEREADVTELEEASEEHHSRDTGGDGILTREPDLKWGDNGV